VVVEGGLLAGLEGATSFDGEQIVMEVDDVRIHVHGDVAWVEGTGRFTSAKGTERAVRTTGVYVRQKGQWLRAQSHTSIGAPRTTRI
jgi:ketosteroid isomerase-like protein